MRNSKWNVFFFICLQNFLEGMIQYLLLYWVYEVYYQRWGVLEGCSDLTFIRYLFFGLYLKFPFWSLPTFYIIKNWFFPTIQTSIFQFVTRNMIISLIIHLLFSWWTNWKYIACSDRYTNNTIHILEIILAGAIIYLIMWLYQKLRKI
jgi:hypothetical protein